MTTRLLGCIVLLAIVTHTGLARATLTAAPDPVLLPSAAVGATSMATTVVTTDQVTETVATIGTSGAGCAAFTITTTAGDSLPHAVTDATPLDLKIDFAPTARGLVDCQVLLRNAGMTTIGTFTVRGTGLAPVITVPTSTSFGAVRVANAATLTANRDVVIANEGDAGQDLTITAISASGDYALASPPTLPATIAAGGSLTVTVTFDPTASGTRAGMLTITSNDPATPSAQAALTGDGTNAVIAVTDVAFGVVPNGTTASSTITVSNTATTPVGPLRVASAALAGGTWFTFADNGAGCAGQTACTFTALDVTTATTVAVRCAPPANATGMQTATVTFASDTDAGGDATASLTCTAGRADIMASATALAFGDQRVGTTSAAQTVTITNVGTTSLTYSATKVGAAAASYTLGGSCHTTCTVAPNGGTESFTVTFAPAAAGDANITLSLANNDPDGNPLAIAVTGRGVEPTISGPAAIAFGNVEVGATSAPQAVLVTNTGTSALTITSATVSAGGASYTAMGTAGTQTVPAGGTTMWTLVCHPAAQGDQPGTFRVVSDAANTPTLSIPLTCTGTRGHLTTTPASHDFGGVAINTTASTTVTLRNTGNLAVSGITATLAPTTTGYSVDATTVPATLAAGASANVTVRFAPLTGADGGAATVTFAGNWGTGPTATMATFTLAGDGLTAGYDVAPATIAFGDVRFDARPTRTFCITNTDQAAVTIQAVVFEPATGTASNEFAVAGIAKLAACGSPGTPVVLPQTLAPNEVLQVTVRAQPQNRVGPMAGVFRVTSNLAVNPNRTVDVTANSTSAMLTLVPGATLDFGTVDVQGAPATANLTLRNTGNAPLDLGSFARTANPSFTFALPPNGTLQPGGEVTIAITYAPTVARAAGSEETVSITHSIAGELGAPAVGTVQLRGRGIDRVLALGATPAFPDTFRNPGTAGPVRIVGVTNQGEAPLTVSATMISNAPEVWKLLDPDPIVIPGGATHELRVRFEPTTAGPAPAARLQLTHDDDDDGPPVTTRVAEVMLTGNGLDRNVAFDPPVIDIGYVEVGGALTLPDAVLVTSRDAAHAFTIQAIEIDGGDGAFTIEGLTDGMQLDPAAERRFAVTFAPATAGTFEARARLFLDMDPQHQAEITIRGTAVFVDARGGGGCDAGSGAGNLATIVVALAAVLALRRRRAAVAAIVGLALAPQAARADENVVLSVFDPTPATAQDGFQLQSAAVGKHGEWVGSAVFSYASEPLLHLASEGGQHGVITRSTLVELGGAVAIAGRFELGARLPLYTQDGEARGDRLMEYTTDPASGTATGDLALHGKVQLLRRTLAGNGSFVVGSTVVVTVPTATDGKLTGTDNPTSRLLGLATLVPGAFQRRVTLSANAGVVVRAPAAYRNLEQKSGFAWGLGASVRVADPLWVAAEVFGDLVPSGREAADGAMTTLSPIEWLGGLRWRPDRRFTISLAGGRGLTSAAGAPALRGVLALAFTPNAEAVRPIHAPEPLPPDVDRDADGVFDRADRCPGEPEDADLFDDQDGCPDLDNDRDGIADTADRCALDAEDKDGFEDADGCVDRDNDGDGFADANDKCIGDAEDKDGFQDTDGCPELDNDRDGIADANDKCPNELEVINGTQDDDGCPDRGDALVMIGPDRLDTLAAIQFQGGAKLSRSSFNLLGQIAATLRARPEILRLRVTCHVQPSDDPDRDLQLSEKRAQAVREWLVQWGIAANRVDARGLGGTKPLVPPGQRGAAALNDRIELIIMEKK